MYDIHKVNDEGKYHIKQNNPDAATATKNGRLLYRKRNYEKAIVEFKTSLKLRESFIGRYDEYTASIYFFLGNCYLKIQDYDNAIVAYRTRLRIRRWLAYDDNSTVQHRLDDRIISSLEKKGFNYEQIKSYDSDLTKSIQYEKLADIFRAKGNYPEAIKLYKEAIAVEKKSQIGIQLTVAFLWRKIGYLIGKNDDSSSTFNDSSQQVDEADNCDENDDSTRSLDESFHHEQLTSDMMSSRNSNLEEEENQEDDDDETNVFQAIQNLANDSNQEINWQSVVDCIDVRIESLERLQERTRRTSMPLQIKPRQGEESDKGKLFRHSCPDIKWSAASARKEVWEKRKLSSVLFSL